MGARSGRVGRFPPSAVALFSLLFILPALATEGFSYRWKTPRVTVTWSEGNESAELPALRREIAHWKRLAQTLWAEKPSLAPLQMEVSLYDQQMGSDGPRVTLRSTGRTEQVAPPISEEGVFQALCKLRGDTSPVKPPPDDADARVSPEAQWISTISWRGGSGPEVWVTGRDADTVTRIPFQAGKTLMDRLILTVPEWSPDGRVLAWVQGGRLVVFDRRSRGARLATPPGKKATEFVWSPNPTGPMLVQYEDESFSLLDGSTGTEIPISELLKGVAPMGRFLWSPTGRRLLFRTQTRIEVAPLTIPGKAANAWDRFLGRMLGGPPEPPQPRSGEEAERLAVLDLAARRLDTFPLTGGPLDGRDVTSASWSPDEKTVFAVSGSGEEGYTLVRFPLDPASKAVTLRETKTKLIALGWRPVAKTASEEEPAASDVRHLFLEGDALLLMQDGDKPELSEVPETDLVRLTTRPGPQGGYLGVESDAVTEDEPGGLVLLEKLRDTRDDLLTRRAEGSLIASIQLDSPMVPLLQKLAGPETVQFDYWWEKGQTMGVGVISKDGGVGEMTAVTPHRTDPMQAVEIPLSQRITAATAVESAPTDQPFPLTDVQTGSSTIALRYAHFDRGRVGLVAAAVLIAFLLIIYLFRKRLGRG